MVDLDKARRILADLKDPSDPEIPTVDVCALLEACGCESEEEGSVVVYMHPDEDCLTFSVDRGYNSLPRRQWEFLESMVSGFLDR
jgi:hypothetical protein